VIIDPRITQLPALATDQKMETTLQPILVHEFKRRVSTSWSYQHLFPSPSCFTMWSRSCF